MPHYNVFVSHKRSDAQDFARTLHTIFVSHDLTCFLDVEDLEVLEDLEFIAAGVDVVVFVLTDNIFQSEWCLKELAAAVIARVPVVLVTKEGARWEHDSVLYTFPPEPLINTLEPPECRLAFLSNSVTHSNEYFSGFVEKLVSRVRKAVESNIKRYPEKGGLSSGAQAALAQRQRLQQARLQAGGGKSLRISSTNDFGESVPPLLTLPSHGKGYQTSSMKKKPDLWNHVLPKSSASLGETSNCEIPRSVSSHKQETEHLKTIEAPEVKEISRKDQEMDTVVERHSAWGAQRVPARGMSCCVFYCCSSRVLPNDLP
uniref:TIR domain-containing protein n=1 Tax=Tetraselmis sp. GSL018 TaxID=582737 RepID=A0A061RFA1_9CHLO